MGIFCLFGHKWKGCRCERCGETRDVEHDFQPEKRKCSERCSICGKTRPLEHQWHGCKCERCGEIRDVEHDFQPEKGKCSERCSICGKIRPLEHIWNGNKCERCGADREKIEIARVSTLRELGLSSKDGFQIKSYAQELNNIASGGGSASHQANLALKDIVLNNQNLGGYFSYIVGYITDSSIAEDPVILHKISEFDPDFCPNTADHKHKREKVAGSEVKIDSETRQIMYHMERCTQCGKEKKVTDYDYDTDGY